MSDVLRKMEEDEWSEAERKENRVGEEGLSTPKSSSEGHGVRCDNALSIRNRIPAARG